MKDEPVSPAEKAGNERLAGQPSPARRILVVDDDSELRRLNAMALLRSGYHVDSAEDGAAAWEILQRGHYDLLITDHKMPKVTGVELLAKVHAARMALPAIMITSSVPRDEFARQPWLQPAATLLKPYTRDELLGTVREILRASEAASGPSAPPPHISRPSLPDRLQL